MKKDSIAKHVQGEQHKIASELSNKVKMGAAPYHQAVLQNTSIGTGLTKMASRDKEHLRIKFNSVYYLLKQERPFLDYPELLKLHLKNKGPEFGTSYKTDRAAAEFTEVIAEVERKKMVNYLSKARYFSVLNDGSSDSSVSEKELVYALFLVDGKPEVTFISIESVKVADAAGILDCIKNAFNRIGIIQFTDRVVGLNVDGASVNTGKFTGLGVRVKAQAPWLQLVHCFNHRLELAIKDAFQETPAYSAIETFITKLYYLYQQSPKRLQALKELAEAHQQSVPKPTKTGGTRWIDFKYNAMKNALDNYGIYMTHVEELAVNDSQPKKRAEIKGFLAKWKEASIPINMAIYLDVLAPLRRLSLAFQAEFHDPVKHIKRVQEFTWTMGKLKLLIDKSLSEENKILTHYKRFLGHVVTGDTESSYQGITLHNYNSVTNALDRHYREIIVKVSDSMEMRFHDLSTSPVFKHLIQILDTRTWPVEDGSLFGESAIIELGDCFELLLRKNGCDVEQLTPEWISLKTHVIPIIKNNPKEHYVTTWQRIFKSDYVRDDCGNILHIIEILLCTPFTNAKLERMFSRMACVKTDFRNRLGRRLLDACLRVSEDGPELEMFDPDPAISLWYEQKIRRLSASSHKYPKKRKNTTDTANTSSSVVDLSSLTISDLDSDDDNLVDSFDDESSN